MIRALQSFTHYLPRSQQWLFNLLDALESDIYIQAKTYDDLCKFPRGHKKTNLSARYSLIHSHFAMAGYSDINLARDANIPHIVSFYGYDYAKLPHMRPEWKSRYNVLFHQADYILCEGDHGYEMLSRHDSLRGKIRVLHLGVDVNNIPYSPLSKKPGELNIVQVARPAEKKGHMYTLAAFAKAKQDCPNATLTFAGCEMTGDHPMLKQQIEDAIRGYRIDGCTLSSAIPYADLHFFLGEFHVFMHPSIWTKSMDCEGGAPTVLLDAQAVGLPVISTNHCDIPSEVLADETGILTEERDVDGLADAIRRFYWMDSEEYRRFSITARDHMQADFNIIESARELMSLYEEAVGYA